MGWTFSQSPCRDSIARNLEAVKFLIKFELGTGYLVITIQCYDGFRRVPGIGLRLSAAPAPRAPHKRRQIIARSKSNANIIIEYLALSSTRTGIVRGQTRS